MKVILARNVNDALPKGMLYLLSKGVERESRNGDVLVSPMPVTTVYDNPRERVLFWPERDANPFFHFFECLWMMHGSNTVEPVAHYVKRMRSFSDDGRTLHGAYGHRWRFHFGGINQPLTIVKALQSNPEDRRNVLTMWDPECDLGRNGKDVPCNTHAYFGRDAEGRLDMTVCCRSNDIIWGAYGANAVHFSFLQEFMAGAIGCEVGRYWQMSNNYHAYRATLDPLAEAERTLPDPYIEEVVRPFPIITVDPDTWLQDLQMFLEEGVVLGLREPFFRRVAQPIVMAHEAYKTGSGVDRYETALEIIAQCRADDWRFACRMWLERRRAKYLRAADDGPAAAGES